MDEMDEVAREDEDIEWLNKRCAWYQGEMDRQEERITQALVQDRIERHDETVRAIESAVVQAIKERDKIVLCPACSDDAGTPMWHEPQPPEHQTSPDPSYRQQAEEIARLKKEIEHYEYLRRLTSAAPKVGACFQCLNLPCTCNTLEITRLTKAMEDELTERGYPGIIDFIMKRAQSS